MQACENNCYALNKVEIPRADKTNLRWQGSVALGKTPTALKYPKMHCSQFMPSVNFWHSSHTPPPSKFPWMSMDKPWGKQSKYYPLFRAINSYQYLGCHLLIVVAFVRVTVAVAGFAFIRVVSSVSPPWFLNVALGTSAWINGCN